MPFTVSVPKTATSLPHRKVTIEHEADGTPVISLKEMLLASGGEPKDVLPMFGLQEVQTLVQLESIWDVIEGAQAKFPTIFDECQDPTMRLCASLLAKKMRPMDMNKQKQAAVKALLEMQVNWEDIKASHQVAAPTCDFCGIAGPVLRCSGCMAVRKEIRYCNQECQKAGWKQHKKDGCGRFASEGAKEKVKKACGGE